MSNVEPAITLSQLSKSFGQIEVLHDVSIQFNKGEIHALVGENGAGKSTLGKIIGGFHQKTAGDIIVGDQKMDRWDTPSALSVGIAIMHQELQVVPALTVAQNVFLGLEKSTYGLLDDDENQKMADISEVCGFDLEPGVLASSLSLADQQKIEIMRALARQANVIVMDEPTSSLTEDEAQKLHQTMKRMAAQGKTIIYVTHYLAHVLETADRVSILRDGKLDRTSNIEDETKATIIAGMLGQAEADTTFPPLPEVSHASPILEVENLNSKSGIRNVSFDIKPGEIVGLVGLVGSGRTEIARAIYGLDETTSGNVLLNGLPFIKRTPEKSLRKKLAFVPEDRRGQGLFMSQNIKFNITIPYLKQFAKLGMVRQKQEQDVATSFANYLQLSPRNTVKRVSHFSGGNQQKALIGRALLDEPKLLILDDPSRGVDVGARRKIHELMIDAVDKGTGILLISSEIDEVIGMSHRILLVSEGEIIDEVPSANVTTDMLLHKLFSAREDKSAVSGE